MTRKKRRQQRNIAGRVTVSTIAHGVLNGRGSVSGTVQIDFRFPDHLIHGILFLKL